VNVHRAADAVVWPRTNELFVADWLRQPPRHRRSTPTPARSSGPGAPSASRRAASTIARSSARRPSPRRRPAGLQRRARHPRRQ
jgi:hypothetical protein